MRSEKKKMKKKKTVFCAPILDDDEKKTKEKDETDTCRNEENVKGNKRCFAGLGL